MFLNKVLNFLGTLYENMSTALPYSHLPNKRADPNKRAGRDIFFVYYMKKCCRGGLFFRLLHEKVLQGRIIFSKMLSKQARLLGR